MELPTLSSVVILAVSVILCFCLGTNATVSNETDKQALIQFKAKVVDDPLMVLSSWNDTIHFCQWQGVTCSRRHHRVTMLLLPSQQLMGSISPYIGNLSFLMSLNLRNNSFSHEIPQEIGRLHRLSFLLLSHNSLGGRIPNVSGCSNLQFIILSSNQLTGEIPVEFGFLSQLRTISLSKNKLTGTIPQSLGNLSSLQELVLRSNDLGGSIPNALAKLTNLAYLQLESNQFSGQIPPFIFNMSSIRILSLGLNQIQGSLPWDMGITLPNLQVFNIYGNQFTGSIPPSISNASNLLLLDITGNSFTGKVPPLEKLHMLQRLTVSSNQLGNGGADDLAFFSSLTNATSLEFLAISSNNFGGLLPQCVSNLSSTLKGLKIDNNNIAGRIPGGIGNLINLERIEMWNNRLSGNIPSEIGKLQRAHILFLHRNNLSGNIPHSLGNLSMLLELSLSDNDLQGNIPSSLGSCQSLSYLNLSNNNLSGTIPPQVIGLSCLSISLDLSRNRLTGPLPMQVGNLKNLGEFDISENMLIGEIPGSLGSCNSLIYLDMQGNFFQGTIPSSLASLRGLQVLDLSRNNLSGKIPDFLKSFKVLDLLNLSYNNFEGMVPTEGIFNNASAISVVGNSELCGGIPKIQLPKCNLRESKKTKLTSTQKLIVVLFILFWLLAVICMLFCFYACWLRRKRKEPVLQKANLPGEGSFFLNLSYPTLRKATNGFSSANLLGEGSFGSVYKGIIDEGQMTIAVKVLNPLRYGAFESFIVECEVSRNIRHRNLVKLLTVLSGFDDQGNDLKMLVYEFMENGSLEDWLHPAGNEDEVHQEQRHLNLCQRLNIAVDVANALEYLHCECQTSILHCDIKPGNILLDGQMIGHLGDFGLARFYREAGHNSSTNQSSSLGVRGTIGYIPPEYGTGNKFSPNGDTYSFGILLLELLTGKRPTDDMFQDSSTLRAFVQEAVPERVINISDPNLFHGREDQETVIDFHNPRIQDCLVSMFHIGLVCSLEQPKDRISMKDVVHELQSVKKSLLRTITCDDQATIRP